MHVLIDIIGKRKVKNLVQVGTNIYYDIVFVFQL